MVLFINFRPYQKDEMKIIKLKNEKVKVIYNGSNYIYSTSMGSKTINEFS